MNNHHVNKKVVVITGGNSGVGYALAQRLLALEMAITICLACRNMSRAEAAKSKLRREYPGADVHILQLDTSSIISVNEAAKEIQQRYRHVDYLYLNAGIMPQMTLNWRNGIRVIFHPSEFAEAFTTGEGLITMVDGTTDDGLKLIFATNLFGHFLLVRKLENFLCSCGSNIVWTSSNNARRKHFDINNIQHSQGSQPYSSSKFAINILSIALNNKLQDQGVHSHVIAPGFSVTGMTTQILGSLVWTLLYPLFVMLRIVVPTLCITPWLSAEALIWFYQSDSNQVNPDKLYTSCASLLGQGYVKSDKIEYETGEPERLYQRLESLQKELEEN